MLPADAPNHNKALRHESSLLSPTTLRKGTSYGLDSPKQVLLTDLDPQGNWPSSALEWAPVTDLVSSNLASEVFLCATLTPKPETSTLNS